MIIPVRRGAEGVDMVAGVEEVGNCSVDHVYVPAGSA